MESFLNTQPIYLQIMNLIKKQIATSVFNPGQLLESVRELAMIYQVNPNTVQRALSELEREGLVRSERTIGRYITKDEAAIAQLHQNLVDEATSTYINSVLELHMSPESIITAVKNRLKGDKT
jgi:DNA-binding transcriptional regulator YhcF (GntR family)